MGSPSPQIKLQGQSETPPPPFWFIFKKNLWVGKLFRQLPLLHFSLRQEFERFGPSVKNVPGGCRTRVKAQHNLAQRQLWIQQEVTAGFHIQDGGVRVLKTGKNPNWMKTAFTFFDFYFHFYFISSFSLFFSFLLLFLF